jgi:hypothetical protein
MLTTRRRTAVAIVLTAYLFALAVRGERYPVHAKHRWLSFDDVLHGWSLVAVNLAIYGWLCWLGFWFIYRSTGRERLFMIGWFADILSWPLHLLEPRSAELARLTGIAGLAFALMIALWMLFRPPNIGSSPDGLDVRQSP